MREYTVDLRDVTTWDEFIEAFNRAFIRGLRGEWCGNLDAFNDYLWWPEEHPYRLILLGWNSCVDSVNRHKTWDGKAVLDVVLEIINSNEQTRLQLE